MRTQQGQLMHQLHNRAAKGCECPPRDSAPSRAICSKQHAPGSLSSCSIASTSEVLRDGTCTQHVFQLSTGG
eukprot:909507-Amphidinium_carterae.2